MTRRLAQPQQRLEHVDLRAREAVALDAPAELRLEVAAQLVVVAALRGLELADERLLRPRGQLAQHLLLRAAQQQRAQRAREQLEVASLGAALRERRKAARTPEHAGVQELEQRSELAEVILDGSPREREALGRAQHACGARGFRDRVLDRLGLVEDDRVEVLFGQPVRVAEQRAVARDDEVVLGEAFAQRHALGSRIAQHAELGSEALRLGDPAVADALGCDDEPGALRGCARDQREHLDRLAEAHVVREATAETEAAQEAQPAEALTLIGAQLAAEVRGLARRLDAAEVGERGSELVEVRVALRLVLGGEQRIDEAELRAPEAQRAAVLAFDLLGRAQRRTRGDFDINPGNPNRVFFASDVHRLGRFGISMIAAYLGTSDPVDAFPEPAVQPDSWMLVWENDS